MQVEPEIVFDGMAPSVAVEAAIAKEIAKLEEFSVRITACRVVIVAPHRHHHKGKLYDVPAHLTLPGQADVMASHHPDAHPALEEPNVEIRRGARQG